MEFGLHEIESEVQSRSYGFEWYRTQNSENDLCNPNITFYISLNKYIKLFNSFGLGRHLLRYDIVTGTDATLECFNNIYNNMICL